MFNIVIMLLIVCNTYFLASYRYDENPKYTDFKEHLDNFFVAVFTIELLFKLIGLGPKAYIQDLINVFDASIVVISVTEFMLSIFVDEQILLGLRVFKAMRAIRMLKLTRYNQGMRELLK